jgi:hypothetical protein
VGPDLDGADALLPQMKASILVADRAFDAQERVIEPLRAAGKYYVNPSNAKSQNPTLVRQRNLQGAPPH